MNWTDIVILAIILVSAWIGLRKGFIYSMFKIFSFFVSAILAVKAYPYAAKILAQTPVYGKIKGAIFSKLMLQQTAQTPKLDGQAKEAAANAIISNLKLPSFLKGTIEKGMPNPSTLVDMNKIVDAISIQLTDIVIDILALILIYIVIRVGLFLLRHVLQGIAKLPVFKQLDKVGGLSFGAIEGLLTVYIVLAVVMLFNSAQVFKGIYEAINASTVAKFFYENNFIVNWMFPK